MDELDDEGMDKRLREIEGYLKSPETVFIELYCKKCSNTFKTPLNIMLIDPSFICECGQNVLDLEE